MRKSSLINSLAIGILISATSAFADQVINDDLIVTFSECVGNDCVNGENFGFDTLRLKENNLRIKFDDTSNSASFPNNDWQITINDSANGGANKFSIDDITNSRTPFTIEANAPSHSLYVDDGGRVGLGTNSPYTEIHVVDGDTPTLRLQQDGSSGFTPQTWDVAGNETNFFVRDVTNGSTLPLRIRPGAPSSSIDIAADGDVGIGTSSPEGKLHVSGTGIQLSYLESSNNNAVQLRFRTDSENRRFVAVNDSNSVQSQVIFANEEIKLAGSNDNSNLFLTANPSGLTVNGSISTTASGEVHPDYVFKENYTLMPLNELKTFIDANHHLPEVPSAENVAQNGINMTKMQTTLLKKVEELTLYTLKQQEIIDELKMKISKLENR